MNDRTGNSGQPGSAPDTHVVDAVAADDLLRAALTEARNAGKMRSLVTHVQLDEVLDIPVETIDVRAALLHLLAMLPAERVPTGGAVGPFEVGRHGRRRITPACLTYSVVGIPGTPKTC
jgi:hypothetical protein